MTKQMWFWVVAWVAVTVFTFYGWISNIIDLVNNFGVETTAITVLRIIGVVAAPIGVFMGYVF